MKGLKFYPFLLAGFIAASSLGVFAQAEGSVQDATQKRQEDMEEVKSDIRILQKLRISGYLQLQADFAQEYGRTRVGGTTVYQPDRDSEKGNFHRFGIRRGRIRVAWEEKLASAVFQLDITERGVDFREAFMRIWDPWKIVTFTGGVFNRPFGDEISYSSALRESPERSRIFIELFPNERDLGMMLTLAAPEGFVLEGLKLDAGLFSGNGIRPGDNSKMDFIGHLKYDKPWRNMTFGIGTSLYHGTTNNADTFCYRVEKIGENYGWAKSDSLGVNTLNKRQYFGIDAQFSIETKSGTTNLRGEYLWGTQPSRFDNFISPESNTYIPAAAFNHIRKFSGGHAYFIQDIYKTPLTFVFKYGYINPNTEWKKEKRHATDLAYNSYGLGLLWQVTSYIRVQAFYEVLVNEKTTSIPVTDSNAPNGNRLNYNTNVADNVFTLRLQCRF